MSFMASEITGTLTICSTKKTSKIHITGPLWRGIHWWPVDSPHKRPVMWKTFPSQDIIMLVVYYPAYPRFNKLFSIPFNTFLLSKPVKSEHPLVSSPLNREIWFYSVYWANHWYLIICIDQNLVPKGKIWFTWVWWLVELWVKQC